MKIAVIAHLKFPISQPYHGGLEMHTHLLVEGLLAAGHHVTLYALRDSDQRFRVVEPPLRAVPKKLGIDLFENEPAFDLHFVNRLHSYLSVMTDLRDANYDIVHNNSLHFAPLALASTLSCPMVTTLHTPPFPSLQSGVLLAKSYLGHHFVAVSDSLGKDWQQFIPNYEVVHNGLRPESWQFSDRAEERTAVWVGRFCEEKGPEYAIAAARLGGYRLQLVGTLYDQAYFDRVIAPELDDQITYLGHLDHDSLSAVIGSASVGLFTSTWDEPFGLVLIEMLACGTPVVAFDSGAAAEILTPECGVVVPKGDVASLARALPLAAGLDRRACRHRAIADFPVSRMVAQYEHLYRKLLKTSSAPSMPPLNLTTDVA